MELSSKLCYDIPGIKGEKNLDGLCTCVDMDQLCHSAYMLKP